MKSKTPKKKSLPKELSAKKIVDDAMDDILDKLRIKLTDQKLKIIRDRILWQYHLNWKKNSLLAKAFRYHMQKADLNSSEIQYHHLLMAELIRTFSIADVDEYHKKCLEFRIYPFAIRKIKTIDTSTTKISKEEFVELMKKSFHEMLESIEKDSNDEISSALSQDYPICSFEELYLKSRSN
jgi:hypothetical protein